MSLLDAVDWNSLPEPHDDGDAAHLQGLRLPSIALRLTAGDALDLSRCDGLTVIYAYPMTGRPDRALPDDWDMIPGARGCTPQSCAFRDQFQELRDLGVRRLLGVSTQSTDEQREAAARLHLPFALASDADLSFARALRLPTFEAAGATRLKRLTLIARDGVIEKVFYPVFPPDRNAADVVDWLKAEGRRP